MARNDTQFNLRIPLELKEQIEDSAKSANRSINAEAVSRLYQSYMLDQRATSESIKALEALLQRSTPSARRMVIAERLNTLVNDINEIVMGKIKPARIAMEIGESYAEPVENWFEGKTEPSFKQLEAVALYLGAVPEWLQLGEDSKYPVHYSRVPESSVEGVAWLLDLDQPVKPTHIYFIRQLSAAGELLIIKKYNDWRCTVHLTPYHVSEMIGSGGESSLAHLMVIWHLLYKVYVSTSPLIVQSFLLSPEEFNEISRGQTHPLKPLQHRINQPWWEDIWERDISKTPDYWSGWEALCLRMQRAIAHRSFLSNTHEQIFAGQHPFVQEAKLRYKNSN